MNFNKIKRKITVKSIFKSAVNIAVLIIIFGAGVGVGNGKITFGQDAVYRKSTQKGMPEKLDYSGVDEIYNKLKQSFDGKLDASKLEDGMKQGLVKAAGDPYTEYMNSEAAKDFNDQLNGSFEGIGAELGKKGNFVVIVSPIAGFPAEKAGLKSKDIIMEINGEQASDISIEDAVSKIRGPKGTDVKLKVSRDGKPLEFTITRAVISIPSVEYKVIDGNIGLITISRFGDDTVELATKAANDFKSKNVKGIILDLRSNPGGNLDAAVGLSDLWLKNGETILQEKRSEVLIKTYSAEGPAILYGMPTVVLINGGSASASEIVTGALKDNKVAYVIGEKSYGKGSVQELRNLSYGGLLKVTIARWFTPGGINIDKEGIEPNKKVKLTEKDVNAKNDTQQKAAINYLDKN